MRISTLLIVGAVAAGVGIGATKVGHAVDEPARQLQTVIGAPAQSAGAAASANLQSAVAAAASYRLDHGSYAGMSTDDLRSYDNAIAHDVSVKAASGSGYCMQATVEDETV